MRNIYIFILLAILSLVSCKEEATNNSHHEIIGELNDDTPNTTTKEVEEILASIPAPKEITATIKASGAPYSGLVVNNPQNAETYSTNYRKAINLGIYGTDLGYMGIYDQSSLIAPHIKVISQLATDIDLAHLLRSEKMKNLLDQGGLTDSVFHISSNAFDEMCKYLQTNERHETSVLMLLGGWLEAIHIATSVAYNAEIDNRNLNNKIAEQKLVLNKFIEILEKYQDKQLFKQLLAELTRLKKIYNGIQINESVANKDTSIIVIPTSNAQITDVQLAQITIQLKKIRTSVIQPL